MEVIYVAREALAITKNKELHQSGKRRTPRGHKVKYSEIPASKCLKFEYTQ